jgi:hypothetical protein
MSIMRIGYRATAVLAAAGVLLGMTAASAGAAGNSTAPGQNKIQCFQGSNTVLDPQSGTCTLLSNGAKGKASLDLTSGDPDGDYAGVFTNDSNLYGAPLGSVTQAGYQYSGPFAPQPGNLSYNIPIDTDGNGTTDAYAFVDAFYCPGTNGNVDIVNDPNCGIYLGGVVFYPNWAALVAAFPAGKVATDNFVFVVAERTPSEPSAVWTVGNVKFGKGGK